MSLINRKVKISGIVGLLILSSIFLANLSVSTQSTSRITHPTTSAIWSTNFIHVQNNWSSFPEISGDGSWETPYLIENVIMDATTSPTKSGILIEDSNDVYFKIYNCTITNWGAHPEDGGIKLWNSSDGWVEENTCDSSSYSGIVLLGDIAGKRGSNNNTIYNNSFFNNVHRGIYLQSYCEENKIMGNSILSNNYGVDLWQHCSNNVISDNTIGGNFRGVNIQTNSTNNIVEYNYMPYCTESIYITDDSDSNTIFNNTIVSTSGNGIHVEGTFTNPILNTIIDRNYIGSNQFSGIYLSYGENSMITNNIVIDNSHWGIQLIWYCQFNDLINNTVTLNGNAYGEGGITVSNTCDNNDLIENNIENNWDYGMYFGNSDSNLIKDNSIKNHDKGIRFYPSSNENNITGNKIMDCSGAAPFGITIETNCLNNVIQDNFIDNTTSGIILNSNTDNTSIEGNLISNCNDRGVHIQSTDCDGTRVWKNYFIDNGEHARDVNHGDTLWDDGGVSNRGNYWDDYGGVDLGGDGIGDTPYTGILGGSSHQDNFPSMYPPTPFIVETEIGLYQLYGEEPPTFNLLIDAYDLDSVWYYLVQGSYATEFNTYEYLEGVNTQISQSDWDQMDNGTISIVFQANDSLGFIGEEFRFVFKDIIPPILTVLTPSNQDTRSLINRSFSYTVDSSAINVWYTIEDGPDHQVSGDGEFDQSEWDTAWNDTPYGESFTVIFYAEDVLGQISSISIEIYTDKPDPNQPDPIIPFGYMFIPFALISLISLAILVKRKTVKN